MPGLKDNGTEGRVTTEGVFVPCLGCAQLPRAWLHSQLLRSSLWRVNALYVDCGVVTCIHICDQGVHNYINKIISYSWLYFIFTIIMWKIAKRVHRQRMHRAFLCSTFEITWISVIISNMLKTNAGENLVLTRTEIWRLEKGDPLMCNLGQVIWLFQVCFLTEKGVHGVR